MVVSGFGISLRLPVGWEGRIFMPDPDPDAPVLPIVHAGSFALPSDSSAFGSVAIGLMNGRGAFLALMEYGAHKLGRPAFAQVGLPLPLARDDFQPHALHLPRPGLVGYQRLFSLGARPFSFQAVIGLADMDADLAETNEVLRSLIVEPGNWATL